MRVGFINTPGDANTDPFRIAPIGSLLLLTILEQRFGSALNLSFVDLRGIHKDAITKHIPELDIYLHYTTTPEWDYIHSMVKTLRQLYPKSRHFAGGPHVKIFPASRDCFDSVCLGEGEEMICRMMQDALKGSLAPVYENPDAVDINQYPFPERKWLPKAAITMTGLLTRQYHDVPSTSVLFSRGCPFACHFCSNQYRRKTQYRSASWVEKEIEYLKCAYGVRGLLIKDDNGIPADEAIAKQNIPVLGKAGMLWRAQMRANGISSEILRLAKDNGCVEITVAIESVWQKSLDMMHKQIDLIEAKQCLREINDIGIDLKLLFILGLPGEPSDIARRTIEFIEEVRPVTVSLSILCPIPGSAIYQHPERFGLKINHSIPFSKYMFAFGRFNDDEKAPIFFEYENGLSSQDVLNNHATVQNYLRSKGINW